ncbi:MAG TPA: glycoside hydrolase 100 family protein, partial [Thiohalobacter sp.]|nr:glycoside hydrolase 100 family protein [Thiohalobacter sp.]
MKPMSERRSTNGTGQSTLKATARDEACRLLDASVMVFDGCPVGTVAAGNPSALNPDNYRECFIRDFFVSGLVFLADGKVDIVRNFLLTTLALTEREHGGSEQTIHPSVMPASFRVVKDTGTKERLVGDFGERAIGRVAPVDSTFWWTLLFSAAVQVSGDRDLVMREDVQRNLKRVLALSPNDAFEVYPTLMVPDGAFMVDRRLGVYGHPLEIQVLFYYALQRALHYIEKTPDNQRLITLGEARLQRLRGYIRRFYWLDLQRLSEINRFPTEEFGGTGENPLNVNPESIPQWVTGWLEQGAGYLVGNIGPARMDFRFFTQGNLLAILCGLTTERQTAGIMTLIEKRWSDLVGAMPIKLCYPALDRGAWQLLTGSDPKNRPWSYHNGGNWPVLLWPLVAAAVKSGHGTLAERALSLAAGRLP